MSKFSPLPQRWCPDEATERHALAIADILDTPPIARRKDGLVLFSTITTQQVLPFLVALKTLHAQLGRGRVVLMDDGSLTGEDRAILAHHCSDPELLLNAKPAARGFPEHADWSAFLALLDRRESEYCIHLPNFSVTLAPLPEVATAIGSNCSFATHCLDHDPAHAPLIGDFVSAYYPQGAAEASLHDFLESQLAHLARPDWRYLRSNGGLAGYAAGGPGRSLAAALLGKLRDLVGSERLASQEARVIAANFQLANEPRTQLLPRARYAAHSAAGEAPAFVHFNGADPSAEGQLTDLSRKAIDQLRG